MSHRPGRCGRKRWWAVVNHPPVTAIVSLPGTCHNVDITGHPGAGDAYLRNGIPVGRVYLGGSTEGSAYGSRPVLDALTLLELDELLAAVSLERDRVAAWDERGAVA
jgi:hypothetical protein